MVSTVLAAAALGLLTGYLVGLSSSPVVAAVVSAVLAMAAGVTALSGIANPFRKDDAKADPPAARTRRHDFAALAFAVAAGAGVSGGLWARNHNLFSPDPAQVQAAWIAAGFDNDTAARIALMSLTGISIAQDAARTLAVTAAPHSATTLFSSDNADACQRTDPAQKPSADETRRAWRLAPGDWPGFADAMAAADQDALTKFWRILCADTGQ